MKKRQKILIALLGLLLTGQSAKAKEGLLDFSGKTILPFEYSKIAPVSDGKFILFVEEIGFKAHPMIPDQPISFYYKNAMNSARLVDSNGNQVGSRDDLLREAAKYGLYEAKDNTPKKSRNKILDRSRLLEFHKADGKYIVKQEGQLFSVLDKNTGKIALFPKSVTFVSQNRAIEADTLLPCRFKSSENKSLFGPGGYGAWGYCDVKGTIVIPPRFGFASDFENGIARVSFDSKQGVIDRAGNWVLEPRFADINIRSGNRIIATEPTATDREWKSTYQKSLLFAKLLNEYDFIGMPATRLNELIPIQNFTNRECHADGVIADFRSYVLEGSCTSSSILDFALDKEGKILGWRYGSYTHSFPRIQPNLPLITENVTTINKMRGLEPANLVPKSEVDALRKLERDQRTQNEEDQ